MPTPLPPCPYMPTPLTSHVRGSRVMGPDGLPGCPTGDLPLYMTLLNPYPLAPTPSTLHDITKPLVTSTLLNPCPLPPLLPAPHLLPELTGLGPHQVTRTNQDFAGSCALKAAGLQQGGGGGGRRGEARTV